MQTIELRILHIQRILQTQSLSYNMYCYHISMYEQNKEVLHFSGGLTTNNKYTLPRIEPGTPYIKSRHSTTQLLSTVRTVDLTVVLKADIMQSSTE